MATNPPRRMKQMKSCTTSSSSLKPSSVSSTNRRKKTTAAATAKKNTRRVFFVEERNTVREYEAVDRQDTELLESLWQQGWEMHNCKQDIKVRAKKWRQTGMGAFLNDAYHCDNNLNPMLCQKQLNTLAQLPDEMHMRGVERYLSRKHDQERTTRKRSIIREVVSQYRTLQIQVNVNALTVSESQTVLAQFARSLNHDAEIFARRIGKADELVMRKGPARSIRPAQELLEYLHDLELERLRNINKKNSGGTIRGAGQLKAAPPPAQQQAQSQPPVHASATFTGRRLQARQA